MKKIVLLVSLLSCLNSFSQNSKVNGVVSKLTEVMLEKYYSADEIKELVKSPVKLKTLDYIYSKSFQIQSPASTETQTLLIDINKYNLSRKLDDNVLVFDEASGLQLVLFSLNKMEADKKQIMPEGKTQEELLNKLAE